MTDFSGQIRNESTRSHRPKEKIALIIAAKIGPMS